MRDPDDKKQFAQIVRSTMLVCGGDVPEPDMLRIWWASLQNYDINTVSAAFSEYAMRGKYAPKPADILGILDRIMPDGRPGADEAWAMIPMDEYTSSVITQEMAEALHIAQPLLDAGDKIAARMSFKEAYSRIMDTNKRNGIKPSWFPSLGQDKEGRESVLAEAVRLGRIGSDHAVALLPPERAVPMLEHAGAPLAIENKPIRHEQAAENIARMKAMIANSKLIDNN
jgi:hypothetical protein